MLNNVQTKKWSRVIIVFIVTMISFVFIFDWGMNPRGFRGGMSGGAAAGSVNGEPVSVAEFNRMLNQQMEFFKNFQGGKLPDNLLSQIKGRVFQQLVERRLILQEITKIGRLATDEQIRKTIEAMPQFQNDKDPSPAKTGVKTDNKTAAEKDGVFDPVLYRQLLQANNYTVADFEKLIREDLSLQNWQKEIKERVKVSDLELKHEFELSQNKRNIKFVLFTNEAGRKDVTVTPEEIKKFLADTAKDNLVRAQFERKKGEEFKGKTYEQVREQIARDLIAAEKPEEIKKANEKLAERVSPMLTPNIKAKNPDDAKIDALLKPYGVSVKLTGMVSEQDPSLPGLGTSQELSKDAFTDPSPIDRKVKLYHSSSWVAVAMVVESQKPDLSKFDAEKEKLSTQLLNRKEMVLSGEITKKLRDKAKIVVNDTVVGTGSAEEGDM